MNRIKKKNIKFNIDTSRKYFVYMWEVEQTKLRYVGYHKGTPHGEVDINGLVDTYTESSCKEEFREQFADKNMDLIYTVFDYFETKDEALDYEGEQIRTRKLNGENMANITNGKKPKMLYDIEKINGVAKKIKNQEYKVEIGKIEELKTTTHLQIRYEESKKKMREIALSIRKNLGDISNTDPLIFVSGTDEVLKLGDKVQIGGAHTKGGLIHKDSKAVEYKFITIDLSGWTKKEIVKLGRLLNDRVKTYEPMKDNDYVKELLDYYISDGIKPDSPKGRAILDDYESLDDKRKNTIIKKAAKKVKKLQYTQLTNRKWKDWDSSSKEYNKLVEQYTQGKDHIETMLVGSGKLPYNRIHNSFWDEANGCWDKKMKVLYIFLHHTDEDKKDEWDLKQDKKFKQQIKYYNDIHPFKTIVKILDHDEPDTTQGV